MPLRSSMPLGLHITRLVLLIATALVSHVTGARAAEELKVEVVPIVPHAGTVTSVAFSPDGRRVFSASTDRSIAIWDIETGRLLRTLEGHGATVTSISVAPDGKSLASAGRDETIQIWDPQSGRPLKTLRGHKGSVQAVAFAPDSGLLASAGADGDVRIWDVESGNTLRHLEGNVSYVNGLAYSPKGTFVAAACKDGAVRLWRVADGELVRTYWGHDGEVNTVAFAHDESWLVSGGDDNMVRQWDMASWKEIGRYADHGDLVLSLAVSSDDKRIVSASQDRSVKIWKVGSAGAPVTLRGHQGAVMSVAISADGARLASGSKDKTIRLWEFAYGVEERTLQGSADRINAVAFARDGSHIFSGGGDTILRMWSATTGELKRAFPGHKDRIVGIDVSLDGRIVASASLDETARIWDVATGKLMRTLEGHGGDVTAVALFPDNTRVLTGCVDAKVRIFNGLTGELLQTLQGHKGDVNAVALSPDGKRAASAGDDKTVRIWNTETGEVLHVLEGHTNLIASLRFSPNGTQIASASWDGTIRLWDTLSGQVVRTFSSPQIQRMVSVGFSSDGTQLVSGSGDSLVRLWDIATGNEIRSFAGHRGWVGSVAASPAGAFYLSGGNDGTVRLWSPDHERFLASFIGSRNGEWMVTTPEGFFVASPGAGEMASIVRGDEVFSIDQAYQALSRRDYVAAKLAGDVEGKAAAAAAKLDIEKLLDSGHVPAIRIMNRPAPSRSTDRLTVDIEVRDLGGGIGNVEWRIDGVKVRLMESVSKTPSRQRVVKLTHDFILDPGENTIEISAYNGANLVSTLPQSLVLTWNGRQPSAPTMHVLAVGIDKYTNGPRPLKYAVADAKKWSEGLRIAGERIYDDVRIEEVYDKSATLQNLDTVFKRLSETIRKRDVFVFYVAAHGKTEDGKYYLIPQDFRFLPGKPLSEALSANAISEDQLERWLATIKAKKSVVIFDTCESGTMTSGVQLASRGSQLGEIETAVERLVKSTGRTVLTAAMEDQPAQEGYKSHGVFTLSLLDAVARGDTDGDKLIEVTELIGHVNRLVPEITERIWQVPQTPRSSFSGSDFALTREDPKVLAPLDEFIPANPTHFMIADVEVLKTPGGEGAEVVRTLPPATKVRVVRMEGDWALIAIEGKVIGYALAAKLYEF